ncbi:MAG: thymidylate kinase [Nitrospirota bacterium]|jgi:dTMP kinase
MDVDGHHTENYEGLASLFLLFSTTWNTIPPVFFTGDEAYGMGTKKQQTRGLFITLEGIEGSGKSTQIRHLAKVLTQAGYRVLQTREPGGTPTAEAIRHILLTAGSHESVTPQAEALLIFAARCQHVTHLIKPALRSGTVVLCDRFSDSTLAYQGYARGLDRQWLQEANEVATGGLTPDLTLVLDLPVTVGLARRRADQGEQNRLDREAERFHRKVRRGFLALAAEAPHRMKIVDANQSAQNVRDELSEIVLGWMTKPRPSSRRRS